jgi:hypothetical protein
LRRLALAAVAVALVLAGTLTATAAQTPTTRHGSAIEAPPTPCSYHDHPAAEHRQLATETFAYSHWRSPAPGPGAVTTMRVLRGCVKPPVRAKMAADWKAERADLHLQREYRLLATYPGLPGEGRFLQWLVIPAWVVEAETSECSAYGDTLAAGNCRWTIVNTSGSGACGPYQLLGHTSCDTSSPADKMRHHEVAASLPRGSWAVGY